MQLASQFQGIVEKFEGLERRMSDPDIISDQKKYQEIVKQHSELKRGVDLFRSHEILSQTISEAKELLSDPEMKEMAEDEMATASDQLAVIEEEMQIYLLPSDPNDRKNAIVEIRSGTGGEEAALFAADLYRMYVKYAESMGWKVEVLSEQDTGLGGIKEVSFSIAGQEVFSYLKFESGTHRVQRVPHTEASGRIHTSAATVAILPEAEEVDVLIDQKDLRIDVYRASGAGGQHVNKTSSAVRITHEPTGVVVACQDERSQFQNKDKAMRLLRSRIMEARQAEVHSKEAAMRRSQVGSGDRSEKIRTYNFPQSRVTDHRINLTIHALDKILEGDLGPIVTELKKHERLEKLKSAL